MTLFRREKSQGEVGRIFGRGRSSAGRDDKDSAPAAPKSTRIPTDLAGAFAEDALHFGAMNEAEGRAPAPAEEEAAPLARASRPVRVRRIRRVMEEVPAAPSEGPDPEEMGLSDADAIFSPQHDVAEPARRRASERQSFAQLEPEEGEGPADEDLFAVDDAGDADVGAAPGDDNWPLREVRHEEPAPAPRPGLRRAFRAGHASALDAVDPVDEPRAAEPVEPRAPAEPEVARAPAQAPAAESDDNVAYARSQVARLSRLAVSHDDGAEAGTRARTRILGFNGVDASETDPFAAQGATQAGLTVGWLVVIEGPGRGRSFTLTEGVATIGRGEDQVVRLDFGDTAISRSAHASVVYDEESRCYYLGAGTKSNVVRRNGRPVLATEDLRQGDHIRIGETTLLFVALCDENFSWGDSGSEGQSHA